MSPRRVAACLAVALVAAGCTSEPSPAEKSASSQAARQNAIANASLRNAVKEIKLCVKDGDGEYPPPIKNQTGTITMLCGPMGRSIKLSRGNRLSYAPKDGGFTVEITAPDGSKVEYPSGPVEPAGS